MKCLFLIATLLLTGCAAHYDKAGNYTRYTLTDPQAKQVAQNVATVLARRYPARTVFSFPHDNRVFAVALENAVRGTGLGVMADDRPGLHRLTYRLDRLNDHQFFIVITVSQAQFQMIWSDDDSALSRLKTITQYEVTHE